MVQIKSASNCFGCWIPFQNLYLLLCWMNWSRCISLQDLSRKTLNNTEASAAQNFRITVGLLLLQRSFGSFLRLRLHVNRNQARQSGVDRRVPWPTHALSGSCIVLRAARETARFLLNASSGPTSSPSLPIELLIQAGVIVIMTLAHYRRPTGNAKLFLYPDTFDERQPGCDSPAFRASCA
ncbi:hypothetical protein BR93DRAFT_499915 [Coniochaeta sp. PMI_546]|nr:hypothetical protein BR93DRAFT_499915 [Coniochaeta sp. PMI_546]